MTVEDVQARVSEIKAVAATDNDERAHGMERSLWEDVLVAISEGNHRELGAEDLATEAIRTREIDFGRWFA